jgi:hypothetical protein
MNSIWSWKAGIAAWEQRTQAKAGPLAFDDTQPGSSLEYPFWLKQAYDWWKWNRNNPGAAVPAPEQMPIPPAPPNSLPGCSFQANTDPNTGISSPSISGISSANNPGKIYWFGDAELMKSLGGANPNYISWNDKVLPPQWSFNPANSVSTNIAYKFCTCNTIGTCQQ